LVDTTARLQRCHYKPYSRLVPAAAGGGEECEDNDGGGVVIVYPLIYALTTLRRRNQFVAVLSLTAAPSPVENTIDFYDV